MSTIPGSIPVTGFIAPTDSTDIYPTHDALYGLDGLRNVATTSARNSISTLRRKAGMIVGVLADDTYWRLKNITWDGTDNDWEPFSVGGGGIAGSGTLNYIPLWTPDGSTLGNSSIIEDSGNIGIGVVPVTKLDVVGDGRFTSGGVRSGDVVIGAYSFWASLSTEITTNKSSTGNDLILQRTGDGKVGIYTNSPSHLLSVYHTKTATSMGSTIDAINLGGHYSNTAGANPKVILYDDGGSIAGIGVSAGQIDYIGYSSSVDHVFWAGTTKRVVLGGNGLNGFNIAVPLTVLHAYSASNTGIRVESNAAGSYTGMKYQIEVGGGQWGLGFSAGTNALTLLTTGSSTGNFIFGYGTESSPTPHFAYNSSYPGFGINVAFASINAAAHVKMGVTGSGTDAIFRAETLSGSTKLIIQNNGYVAIGSSLASHQLDIICADNGPYGLSIRNNTFSSNVQNGYKLYQENDGRILHYNNSQLSFVYGAGGQIIMSNSVDTISTDTKLVIQSIAAGAANYSFYARGYSVNTGLTVDGDANVGINQFTSSAKLHIKGEDSTSSYYAFKVDNDSLDPLLYVRNDGQVNMETLTGTDDRLVEADTNGVITATKTIRNAYGIPGTEKMKLEDSANWDVNGEYTGTAITGTYQGQKHYDDNYLYEAVGNNDFIRLIRG